jgi:hypothetical protein
MVLYMNAPIKGIAMQRLVLAFAFQEWSLESMFTTPFPVMEKGDWVYELTVVI